jgi:hypothetical protein
LRSPANHKYLFDSGTKNKTSERFSPANVFSHAASDVVDLNYTVNAGNDGILKAFSHRINRVALRKSTVHG